SSCAGRGRPPRSPRSPRRRRTISLGTPRSADYLMPCDSQSRHQGKQMKIPLPAVLCTAFLLLGGVHARAGVGDPQVRTDHPWYPGELACSSFEALFATQAELYQRVVGVKPRTDEQKALAAWLWRNTHYYHGEEGAED